MTTDTQLQKMRDRFLSEPPIMAQFPITVGEITLYEFKASCDHCGQQTPDELCRGTIVEAFGQTMLSGHGICTNCNTIFPLAVRLKMEGGRLVSTHITPSGKWGRSVSRPTKPTLTQRLLRRLSKWAH